MKRRALAFILSISILALNIMPAQASELEGISLSTTEYPAEIEETKSVSNNEITEEIEFQMPTSKEYSNQGELMEFADTETLDKAGSSRNSALSQYDGRKYCTSVKQQLGGTCWAYAELAAMESSLIKSGFTSSNIDLSELQHIYYFYNKVFDPLGNINNDYNYMTSNGTETTDFSRISENGGNNFYSAFRIANGNGLCLESDLPFTSTSDSVTVDSRFCFKNDIAHVKNIYFCTFSPTNITKIKNMITNYGGVAASYYSFNSSNYYRILNGTSSYYFPNSVKSVNHAIEVVGWNDNYSATNFSKTAPGNGAWLCKNSWGTENYLDSNANPVDGYFWLSYYDGTYLQGIAIASAYEFENVDTYDYLYQYDGASKPNSFNGNKAYMNVFEVKGDKIQQIEAVSVGISSSNASYYAKIYVNPVIKDNKIVSYDSSSTSVSKTISQPGIYKTDIESDLYVKNGDKVAVLIKMTNSNSYIFGSKTSTSNWANFYDEMKENQSYSGVESGTDIIFTDLAKSDSAYTPCIKMMTSNVDIPMSTSVSITNKADKELLVGNTIQLSATVYPNDALQGIKWSTTNASVATVDSNGKVSANGTGTCKIRATSYDGKCYDEMNITVKKLAESVSISYGYEDTVYLENNTQKSLVGIVKPDNTSDKTLTWKSSNSSVVSVNNGVIKGLKVGAATITATNKASGLSDTIKVEVINPVNTIDVSMKNIEVVNDEIVLYTNDSSTERILIAQTNDAATNKTLSVNISNPSVVTYNNGTGQIKGIKQGTSKITFTSQDNSISSVFTNDGTITNGTPISKTLSIVVKTKITDIKLTEKEITMNTGTEKKLEVKVLPQDATVQALIYSSNNKDVATVTTDGTIVAKKGGKCTITVSDIKGEIKKECNVTIIQKAQKIEVPSEIYMNSDETYKIGEDVTITVLPENTNNKEVSFSLNGDSVSLDGNDLVALKGGITYLTVSTTDGTNLSETIKINVIKKAEFISVDEKMELTDTNHKKLNVSVNNDASIKNFKFSSSDETIATVDNNGNIFAKGKSGSCEIKAETTDGSNLSAICKVTVKITVKSIDLTANKTTLLLGESAQLNCSVTPNNATNKTVSYACSNTNVITINNNVITAIGKGQAVITATSLDNSNIKKSITITVKDKEETLESDKEDLQSELSKGTVLCDNKDNYYVVLNEKEVKCMGTYNRDAKSVSIPDCISYKEVKLNVVSVADNAFNGCEKLKTIKIGKNVKEIGKNSFKNCKKLKSVTIPNKVTVIGSSAFYGCKSLSKVTIGNGMQTIKTKAFYNCKKLSKITIKSKNLKTVEKNAFKNIKEKATVKVPKSKYKTYTKTTFKKAGFKKVKYQKG